MHITTFTAVSIGLLMTVGCAEHATSPVTTLTASVADKAPSTAFEVVDGSTGPGSLYRLVRPANWNGILVVYAHGYTSPDAPIALPAEATLITSLLTPQGFAVAYSSFSENGWDVKDGAQRTHQLLGIFASNFGQPRHVYIGGASLGGLIAIKLTETYPRDYAGALAACAVAGGTRRLFEYHSNVRALFDFFYPGVLPGNAATLPPGTDVTSGIVLPVIAAMTANPTPAGYMAAIDQTPLPFATPAQLVESIVTALVGNATELTDDLLTNGKPYFDNRSTVYSSALLPAPLLQAINAGIGRFDASPSAVALLDHNYTPSGDLRIPMLMLSNALDPVVPGFNQASYLAAVTANGAANLLVQRQVPVFGHCVFTPAQLLTAFGDLVLWGELGIKPAP